VILAGQVGVSGHLTIGDRCRVGAKSGVGHSLPPKTDVSGIPAMGHATFLKTSAVQKRLPEMLRKLRRLETEVQGLKAALAAHGGGDD
jgi:UDP-3-O-[3-hydroxymyristoyl] glucosamine N-acyltransferase